LKDEFDVSVEWLPFELHPDIPPEGYEWPEHVRARRAEAHARLKQMADEIGIPMVFQNRSPNSRRALEASEYAREQGKHEAFHRVVFRKYYGEGQNISEWQVLRSAAEEVGLNADAMQQATDSGMYHQVVTRQVMEAHAMGITGVPAYVFNNKYVIFGAQPYEIFQQAIQHVLSEISDDSNKPS
jgi:predicted DsbA family dithiol-disulfide isomerase